MADRFPSIEDLDEGIPDVKAPNDEFGDDEDFLARERAALGDDADMFTSNDRKATNGGDDDLLGEDFAPVDDAETRQFQNNFPSIDNRNNQVGPGGSVTGTGPKAASGYSNYKEPEEEPEVVKAWRERRDLALQHRAEVSEKKKESTIKSANQSIDDFYENYNVKKDKSVAQTRKEAEEFLAKRDDTTAGGTSWERISKLVDLTGKGTKGGAAGSGKELFREMLGRLRKDEKAPGASGV